MLDVFLVKFWSFSFFTFKIRRLVQKLAFSQFYSKISIIIIKWSSITTGVLNFNHSSRDQGWHFDSGNFLIKSNSRVVLNGPCDDDYDDLCTVRRVEMKRFVKCLERAKRCEWSLSNSRVKLDGLCYDDYGDYGVDSNGCKFLWRTSTSTERGIGDSRKLDGEIIPNTHLLQDVPARTSKRLSFISPPRKSIQLCSTLFKFVQLFFINLSQRNWSFQQKVCEATDRAGRFLSS